MEKVKTKVKRFGDSFAVILPKEVVAAEKVKEGSEITITIESNNKMTVGDLMEFAKKHPLPKPEKSYRELLNEVKMDFWQEE